MVIKEEFEGHGVTFQRPMYERKWRYEGVLTLWKRYGKY